MARLTTERHNWGFVSGRIDVLEGRMLPREFFLSLIAQPRQEDIFRMLQETALRDLLTPGAVWDDLSVLFDAYFYQYAISLRGDCPDPDVVNFFLIPFDYLNLKHAIPREREFPFPISRWSRETLTAAAGGDYMGLPDAVRDAIGRLPAPDHPMYRLALDLALDGAYLRELLDMAARQDAPLIREYIHDFALDRALSLLWRANRSGHSAASYTEWFLPLEPFTPLLEGLLTLGDPANWHGRLEGAFRTRVEAALEAPVDEQVSHFEHSGANALAGIAEDTRGQTAGPERVFGHMAALQVEIFNLKLAVSGRLSRIDAQVLRRRLRGQHA